MDVTSQVLILFLLIVVGYAARKIKVMDDAAVGHFSAFILNISLPALILNSLQKDFSPELLASSGKMLLLSFVIYGAAFALAALWTLVLRPPEKEKAVHQYSLIFSNVGFMGFPVVEAVMGRDALFHLSIFNIPFNLLAFSVGAWLLARNSSRPLRLTWRTFVNPSVIATLAGFVAFLFSIRYPAFIAKTLKMTGDITSPLSMVVIGAVLARTPLSQVFGRWRVYVSVAARLFLVPALIWLALRALGFQGLELVLPVLVFAMPTAANTTILATVYEADAGTAGSLVFLSTLASVISIPLIAGYLMTPAL